MKATSIPSLLCLVGSALLISSVLQAQRHDRNQGRHDYRDYRPPVRVERVVYTPAPPRQVIAYRGHSYYYNSGRFYRPYGSYVQVVAPPIGIRIAVLPQGYRPVYFGSSTFFYFNGIFYRQADRNYEVVQAPIGAEVPDLPRGAKVIIIDNQKYYELNGSYYKERIRPNGETWYEVMGKNGTLYTDTAPQVTEVPPPPQQDIKLGSVVSFLPDGCRVAIVNNVKYYVSPDQVYYEEYIENNQLLYKVSGVPQMQ